MLAYEGSRKLKKAMSIFSPFGPLHDASIVSQAETELEASVELAVVGGGALGINVKVGAVGDFARVNGEVLATLSEATLIGHSLGLVVDGSRIGDGAGREVGDDGGERSSSELHDGDE